MDIKLIALDLDGTTLNKAGKLSQRTRCALKEASDRGVNIIVATGRPFCALPQEIVDFDPVRYVLTSNGARITDLHKKEAFYENCIKPEAIDAVVKMLEPLNYILEVFVDGVAYTEGWYYREIERTRQSFRSVDYVLNTRKPVDDFYNFMLANKGRIENINVNIENLEEKPAVKELLETLPDVTITSSYSHNLEIGGETTSKAEALKEMCRILDVKQDEMMAAGDSPNDIAMLKAAGLSIAVENAEEEVKAVAKYIAPDHDCDGVAFAVEKFVLNK